MSATKSDSSAVETTPFRGSVTTKCNGKPGGCIYDEIIDEFFSSAIPIRPLESWKHADGAVIWMVRYVPESSDFSHAVLCEAHHYECLLYLLSQGRLDG
jgi:hypothetical protein